MTKLKICGITSYQDACAAIDVGAEFLGFNFFRSSPRYIAPGEAHEIIEKLPAEILAVGIFVNEPTASQVIEKIMLSGVVLAQLHGDEEKEYCRQVGASRVIKALRPEKEIAITDAHEFPASALLIDAFDKNMFGGTGKISNWEAARELALVKPIFLAGGLSPENIVEAIRTVHPYAVDVNSGVEIFPGRKDPAKLQALREAMDSSELRLQARQEI